MRAGATRLGAAASLFLFGSALAGCGLVTMMHDTILGPVSPAGRIHDAAVGSDFEATLEGVKGDAEGETRLRPFPRDLIRTLGSPSSFRKLVTGLEAFFLGASSYSVRKRVAGATPGLARLPTVGASAEDVLAALGPPDRWVHFAGGETMAYRSEHARWTTLNIGIPPALGFFIPIPGASNLAYRRVTEDVRSHGFVLFFDEHRRLELVAVAPPE